jgi:cytochrome c oxidase subunit 2
MIARGTLRAIAVTASASIARIAFAVPQQSALDPAGPQSLHILSLWHTMLALCSLVFVLVVGAAWFAVLRVRRKDLAPPELHRTPGQQRRVRRTIALAVIASGIGLVALVVASVATDRALAHLPLDDALHIEVTGHRWWWEAVYDHADPSKMFHTANELHIPVGRPVIFTLKAADVIHSLWIPNLAGKKDLIPGRIATHVLRADRVGVFRAQCAEFCGYQHALMGMLVVAESPEDWARWAEHQRAAAPPPADPTLAAGQTVFETSTCGMCHAVQGTRAGGRMAPDLTHLASRATLAAGALDNTPASLAAWIADPQHFKPGVDMPANTLPPEQMAALVAWLGTLQ